MNNGLINELRLLRVFYERGFLNDKGKDRLIELMLLETKEDPND